MTMLHGPQGVVSILPFAGLLAVALVVTLVTLPGGAPRRADILDAASALILWIAVALVSRAFVVPAATLASATAALLFLSIAVALQVAVVRRTHASGVVGQ